MPRNSGKSLNFDSLVVWNAAARAPIRYDAGTAEFESRGGFGKAAEAINDAFNDVLWLFHAANYHAA